jgi:hypothetical protein
MKTIKAICTAAILVVALSVPAFAGDIASPGVAAPGDISTPGFADILMALLSVLP